MGWGDTGMPPGRRQALRYRIFCRGGGEGSAATALDIHTQCRITDFLLKGVRLPQPIWPGPLSSLSSVARAGQLPAAAGPLPTLWVAHDAWPVNVRRRWHTLWTCGGLPRHLSAERVFRRGLVSWASAIADGRDFELPPKALGLIGQVSALKRRPGTFVERAAGPRWRAPSGR